ncbi:MAG: hypothetical protein QG622_1409 [Actinomycetota bacterium]|nr:hypothetical protein [Actinomycetota bacterium]
MPHAPASRGLPPPRQTPLPHPVVLEADLDAPSRILWLVKWFLLIPHYVALTGLAVVLLVGWAAAFFCVLVTGRYPRPLFDVTVGILRWGWRVGVYGFGLGSTDRYPPFTLAEVPGYPARFSVRYPERLSRGLVLVTWWLLAIPHYCLIWLLYTSSIRLGVPGPVEHLEWRGPGLLSMITLVALSFLLVRGRYPGPLFEIVVGFHRWAARVTAYALLLTDRYPPFRLDLGGSEPPGAIEE